MFDICIIGAGVIGSAIARELAKYDLSLCLLEKDQDVSSGTSKANSGIVHGGYDAKYGTLKAKFCARGNQLYDQLEKELHFGFRRVGSFVIGFDDQDRKTIEALYENGLKNNARGLKIVDGDFVKKREPYLSDQIQVALYCESAGVISPYEFTIALAENAVDNGVELRLNTEVVGIHKQADHFVIKTHQKPIQSKVVINAAGLYSDKIAKMVGIEDFEIQPKRGEYVLFDKTQGHLVNSIIFQTPTEAGKGVLAVRTYHGNLMIGPSSTYIEEKNNVNTTAETINEVIHAARKSLPNFDLKEVITTFSGNRACSTKHDFIIEESKKIPGFINIAGIESPGLTAAPAIAQYVVEMVAASHLISLQQKSHFNPERRPYHHVSEMNPKELNELIQKHPEYGRIICRCETVSEGEIKDALSRSIPINTLDAVKRRTRAGMGRCQGGFCTPKILEIIYNELGIPVEKIEKKTAGSYIVVGRTKKAFH
ncbi:MAG: NAD(P)/FAD-dependent oxidoreductase [Gammaproteobacteria bacterium]|nr:NAD(P)/FAD-dependent oxidoreductase [Gammaproteobacteria bacterium]